MKRFIYYLITGTLIGCGVISCSIFAGIVAWHSMLLLCDNPDRIESMYVFIGLLLLNLMIIGAAVVTYLEKYK